jgi:two-component system chemotaxis sensor kinase CheA
MSAPSLDDIASRLVQLEPGEAEKIRRLGRELARLLGEAGAPGSGFTGMIRDFLSTAAAKLEAVSEDASAGESAETALVEAGRLIEAAQNAIASGFCDDDEPDSSVVAAEHTRVGAGVPGEPAALPPDIDPSMLGDFITESRENIQAAEAALLTLETAPDDPEAINTIFRAFHTIKGMAAFLGFKLVADLAHHTESFLSRIRSGEIRYQNVYADLALQSVDLMTTLVQGIQDAMGGEEVSVPGGYDDQIMMLQHLEDLTAESGVPVDVSSGSRLGEILVASGKASAEDVDAVAAMQGDVPLGVALVRAEVSSVKDVGRALRKQQQANAAARATEASAPDASPVRDGSVRVRTDRLDRLINLVGELVISQSMLDQDETVKQKRNQDLQAKVGHAGKVVRELQMLSMALRMVPLKATFQKMARLTRDLSQKSGKPVNLVTSGEETEIDRNLVEVVGELLMHMVRNAVDHGIESPEDRIDQGKPEMGAVTLKAFHRGGNIVFEIIDDGKGLSRERIAARAIAKGLIASADGISDGDIYGLIFEPGFSTAETITDVSGRGVGMDVVKRGVESLRGHIETASAPGKGCSFTLRLPLTMAITDGMVVRVADQRYIIPTLSIKMSLRPTREMISTIATRGDSSRGEMLRFMEQMIPIHRLHRIFGITDGLKEPTEALLVIVEDNNDRYALMVDELVGQAQVIAKTLGDGIGRIEGISGGAILGDGRVGLILDVPGLGTLPTLEKK